MRALYTEHRSPCRLPTTPMGQTARPLNACETSSDCLRDRLRADKRLAAIALVVGMITSGLVACEDAVRPPELPLAPASSSLAAAAVSGLALQPDSLALLEGWTLQNAPTLVA